MKGYYSDAGKEQRRKDTKSRYCAPNASRQNVLDYRRRHCGALVDKAYGPSYTHRRGMVLFST
jgi:hypothetical protein